VRRLQADSKDFPEHLRNYKDYEAYARDARLGGDVSFVEHDGDVWVFFNR
jgi:antirestriction protein